MTRTIPTAIALAVLAAVPHGVTGQTPTLAEPAEAAPLVVVESSPAPTVVESAPTYAAPAAAVCCPIEVVKERTTLHAKRFLRCSGPLTETVACVANPAECCGKLYAVQLCVPCCCVGEPRQCNARKGLLGRGYVDLVWDCGYVAKVTFLKHGGVIITYTAG